MIQIFKVQLDVKFFEAWEDYIYIYELGRDIRIDDFIVVLNLWKSDDHM